MTMLFLKYTLTNIAAYIERIYRYNNRVHVQPYPVTMKSIKSRQLKYIVNYVSLLIVLNMLYYRWEEEIRLARSKEFEENVVLDKAMKLFWEQGYEKSSMTDLVEHMGIHRRSLYDTFGDKHTLFLKAMDRFRDKVNAEIAGQVKRAKTATEALELIFDFMINGNEDSPSGCLMVNSAVELAMRDDAVDSKSTESFTLSEQLFTDIILWGQQNGEFNSACNANELAEQLHAVCVGLRVMTKTSMPKEKLKSIASFSIKSLDK